MNPGVAVDYLVEAACISGLLAPSTDHIVICVDNHNKDNNITISYSEEKKADETQWFVFWAQKYNNLCTLL